MAQIYSCLDIYLSTNIAENCSLVLIEALACGLSIVTFDVCSVSELVQHEYNGFLVPFANTKMAIHYLSVLIENAQLRNRFAHTGRSFAQEHFCENKIIQQLESIYSRLLCL